MTGGQALHVLSAGAAKAIVLALAAELRETAGIHVAGTFDAAGAIRARFVAGAPCDVLILPAAMQDALAGERRVEGASVAQLGRVPTGIAVPAGEQAPSIADADALRATLERASALYCPDTERSTAGIHFVRMRREMGIDARVAARVRAYANGAEAMAAMAAAASAHGGAIGCTQVTEILYTPGVALIGPLPPPFELATIYAVAVSAASGQSDSARRFAAQLSGGAMRDLRASSGFLQA